MNKNRYLFNIIYSGFFILLRKCYRVGYSETIISAFTLLNDIILFRKTNGYQKKLFSSNLPFFAIIIPLQYNNVNYKK